MPKYNKTLVYLTLEEATTVSDASVVYKDRFWIHDPDEGLLILKINRGFYPQCNSNTIVCDQLQKALYQDMFVRFMPIVYLPLRYQNLGYE